MTSLTQKQNEKIPKTIYFTQELIEDITENEEGDNFNEKVINRLTKLQINTSEQWDTIGRKQLQKAQEAFQKRDKQKIIEQDKKNQKIYQQEIETTITQKQINQLAEDYQKWHINWDTLPSEKNIENLNKIIIEYHPTYITLNMPTLWTQIKTILTEQKQNQEILNGWE